MIAISGGLDSVLLTHLCHNLKLNISLAHCNFNLRGNESDADEDFVLQLAEDLELEVFIESFDTETFAEDHKLSTQMAARTLRYHWFEELAEQLHFDYVLTAHHADDNLETFLINLSRGTGLDGLTGIPEINGKIVRPLLSFSRETIESYAVQNNIKWREDSSNASTKYLRNKLRHDVIPVLKEMNSQLLQNFKQTQDHLQDSKLIIKDSIDKVLETVITKISEHEIHFSIQKIKELSNPKVYLYEILKEYHFTEWQDITDLLNAQTGKQVFSSSHGLLKNRGELILFRNTIEEHAEAIAISEEDKNIKTALGYLVFELTNQINASNNATIYVDKDLLKYPLTVRKWVKGDYFYPFGMENKKKLSKFFKDEKLSMLEKENIWLLCSHNEVVWIMNHRADNRFKITNNTQYILKISLQNEI
ncbi:tRNA(Ile)-lysidine synthase [Bizionia arctica]|uniref:tRNA(Ile)-lysidine synthase n=1 Tax=Bizionia arctica TaxID=1495645 RepID=A0A917GGV8_9FLAO|nr:tRNA(Ile)-lysidine synthase [Bizionia arctica]